MTCFRFVLNRTDERKWQRMKMMKMKMSWKRQRMDIQCSQMRSLRRISQKRRRSYENLSRLPAVSQPCIPCLVVNLTSSVEYYKLSGRVPWAAYQSDTSRYLHKRCIPDKDHTLCEPSRMTLRSVNVWLKHWQTLQNKSVRALKFLDVKELLPKTKPTTK